MQLERQKWQVAREFMGMVHDAMREGVLITDMDEAIAWQRGRSRETGACVTNPNDAPGEWPDLPALAASK